jgi:TRAP transporter 4TM/12TM fusion protein
LLGISATWVGIFVLFAGLVEGYGGLGAVIGIAKSSSRYLQSGAIQAAVVSSMILGSIMASSTANTATTGSFTIPLMKSQGVRPKTAAAIEVVVSNGGQILPPVMGSSAFIMAQILGISYFVVIQGAFLPAVLFYVVSALVVHLLTLKNGWGIEADSILESRSELSSGYYNNLDKDVEVDYSGEGGRTDLISDVVPLVVGLSVLVVTLIVLRYSPLTAAAYTIVILAPAVLLRDLVQKGFSLDVAVSWLERSVNGCRLGAQNMAPITAVLGSLGIVVVILSASGFSHRLSLGIVSIAVGLFMVLFLAMFASILFGMGLPTPAAYVVVAILTAPALVEFGIQPLVAHMFVFYFALLSSITPPIALAAAVGAGIAGTKFWETAIESVRLGLFAFMIPLMYVQNQELIVWNGTETWIMFGLALVGVFSLSIALVGYDWRNTINYLERSVYLAFSVAIMFTSIRSVQMTASLMFGIFWLYRSRVFRSTVAEPKPET